MMNRLPDAPICERGNDLMSFLYGEIDEGAKRDFERHLLNCAQCESDLGAFKEIRSSVVAWRQESVGIATNNSVSVSPAVNRLSHSKPSAIAAIRQFFELSPLWMKSSTAFAAVIFCVVSVLAVGHLLEKPEPVVVGYTEYELKARIEDAVRARLKDREAAQPTVPPSTATNNKQQDKIQRRVPRQSSESVAVNPKVRRGPLTKSERDQLAADLRLINPPDDYDIDLLDEGNNQ